MAEPRLVLLPYLQRWDGSNLEIRLLVVPRVGPKDALVAGQSAPNLATANFKFDVLVVPADNMPTPRGKVIVTLPSPVPANALALFDELESQLAPDPTPRPANKPTGVQVRKHLPISYRNISASDPRQPELFSTDSTYRCALRHTDWPPRYTKLPEPPRITWGQIIASVLRVPPLAEAAGLVRKLTVPVSDLAEVNDGGFLYVSLNSTSDCFQLVGDGTLKTYATKFPAMTAGRPRVLFTPVLFPVSDTPTAISYAEMFSEVEDYNDGFANVVHGAQQRFLDPLQEAEDDSRPVSEQGIRLGWDDQQVTIWTNRQLDSSLPNYDTPTGVVGYRIDARAAGTTEWKSLVRLTGPLKVGHVDLGNQSLEFGVPVQPVQHAVKPGQPLRGDFWLSMYFASWSGCSLATHDKLKVRLAGRVEPDVGGLKALPPEVRLTYGLTYEFQVRLMDSTGGGPTSADAPIIPAISLVSRQSFRRYIVPLSPQMLNQDAIPADPDPQNPPNSLQFKRPLLQYPAISCTAHYANVSVSDLEAALLGDMEAAKVEGREPGLPDPDVDRLLITVEVKSFSQDPLATDDVFMPIYTTTRSFPTDLTGTATIGLEWRDESDVMQLRDVAQSRTEGTLILPTARTLRIRVSSLCKDDTAEPPQYFGAQDVRESRSVFVQLRKESANELGIFDLRSERDLLNAYFLQPDDVLGQATGDQTPIPTTAARFANALGLKLNGLTLKAEGGRRVIFGCSAGLRHLIGPDGATLTFSTAADLARRWLTVIRLTVARDWTWDGFATPAITIARDGVQVGTIGFPISIGLEIFVDDPEQMKIARTQTEIIFVDSINPLPPPGEFPQILVPSYTMTPTFKSGTATITPETATIRLPVTTNPTQMPKLKSVGIAMSPYELSRSAAPDYSYTTPRQRCLWLEFTAPLQDSRDGYFGRVLRNMPDPLIFPDSPESIPIVPNVSPLAIDPELIVHIVRDQAAGTSGLDSMAQLIPADQSNIHFALPLPTTDASSPLLFGFWSYEFRVGHTKAIWSTAQGRFGPGLVVNGIQHPAPPLTCNAVRQGKTITASAPHAASVLDGTLRPGYLPRTSMWFLLYTQASQIDGADAVNVLLGRVRGAVSRAPIDSRKNSSRYVDASATGVFVLSEIDDALRGLGFHGRAGLSVLAVEVMPSGSQIQDPLGADLGKLRILRASPLTPVPGVC